MDTYILFFSKLALCGLLLLAAAWLFQHFLNFLWNLWRQNLAFGIFKEAVREYRKTHPERFVRLDKALGKEGE